MTGWRTTATARVKRCCSTARSIPAPAPGAGTPSNFFIPGERVAVWLTTPTAGTIVGVQILWDSLTGGNPPSQEAAIRISAVGAFPVPGAQLAMITAPVLADTTVNEFRFLDPPADTISVQVPVTAGQTFVVDLEIFNSSSGIVMASGIEHDAAIPFGRNAVLPNANPWADAIKLKPQVNLVEVTRANHPKVLEELHQWLKTTNSHR